MGLEYEGLKSLSNFWKVSAWKLSFLRDSCAESVKSGADKRFGLRNSCSETYNIN